MADAARPGIQTVIHQAAGRAPRHEDKMMLLPDGLSDRPDDVIDARVTRQDVPHSAVGPRPLTPANQVVPRRTFGQDRCAAKMPGGIPGAGEANLVYDAGYGTHLNQVGLDPLGDVAPLLTNAGENGNGGGASE